MPKVSVIIPTHNRPEMLKRAVMSVLAQIYDDLEIIVVDDGLTERAKDALRSLDNKRVKYIAHDSERGGSAARNTGIKNASGDFVAFLDDDDEWLPEKLQLQMERLERTPLDVGFCFTAATNLYDDHEENTLVPDGVADYLELVLGNFKGFLTVTLLIKKYVLDSVGVFDETLPSHQEVDLVIRISKKYRGIAINKPLVLVNMRSDHERVGSSFERRITGREIILEKHIADFRKYPCILAQHYFWLGITYRDNGDIKMAKDRFRKAFFINWDPKHLLHFLSMLFDAMPYKLLFK